MSKITREEHILHLYNMGVSKETIRNVCNITIGDINNILNKQPIPQSIQPQASEIEKLRKLNEGKAKEYFKLLEMYNLLDAKLYAIRKELFSDKPMSVRLANCKQLLKE